MPVPRKTQRVYFIIKQLFQLKIQTTLFLMGIPSRNGVYQLSI